MTWTQVYDPLGNALLSTLIAAAPIVVLLGLLALAGWPAPRAAAAGLVTALAVAIFAYQMPINAELASAGFGACFGLFPIGWIVLNAIFLYRLTLANGEFEIVKHSVASLSADRRIQAILIAFSFGAFVEGAAGFGTPVAISAALLIGLGFPPLYAAGLALIANTAPVAFGALGTPITTLAKVSGLDEMKLSAMAGRQLPIFSLIVPAWMVWTMAGWRGLKGVWPAVLVSGGSFAVVQFAVSNWLGPTLVDVAGGLISLVATALFLRIWRPSADWEFSDHHHGRAELPPDAVVEPPPSSPAPDEVRAPTRSAVIRAWVPWALLSACVFLWGVPQFRTLLDGGLTESARAAKVNNNQPLGWWDEPNPLAGWTEVQIEVPYLHNVVHRAPPAEEQIKPEPAVFRFNWLSATGTGILVAAILSALWMGVSAGQFVRIYADTLRRMIWPLFTIAAMMAVAFVTRYSGSDVTLGLAFTLTGVLYPFFAAMLGWLGVALTGSDTSSNALFGSLQRVTAEQLGLNPLLICAANSTGGVMGKMIDAQSIVVAAVATGQRNQEGRILRFVFWHSVVLAMLMGLLTLAQAYVFPWMAPNPDPELPPKKAEQRSAAPVRKVANTLQIARIGFSVATPQDTRQLAVLGKDRTSRVAGTNFGLENHPVRGLLRRIGEPHDRSGGLLVTAVAPESRRHQLVSFGRWSGRPLNGENFWLMDPDQC
jgi:lactate permease